MARRRVISAALLVDERFNRLSMEAQLLFLRMLCISDDYGIVPANEAELAVMLNLPDEIRNNFTVILQELIDEGLGYFLAFDNKRFFTYKPLSFKHWQAQLLSRRRKSEYLRLPGEQVLKLLSQQLHIELEDFRSEAKTSDLRVESRKKKEDSSEEKAEGDIPEVFRDPRPLRKATYEQ
jgi:hypothetical protein